MSGRFQPAQGADSPEGTRPYKVLLVDRNEDDARPYWVTFPACFGPKDAKNHALDAMPTALIFEVREAA